MELNNEKAAAQKSHDTTPCSNVENADLLRKRKYLDNLTCFH